MKTVAIIAKPHGDRVRQVTHEIVGFLSSRGVEILFDERAAAVLQLSESSPEEVIRERADLIIVLGGDGTLISAVRLLGEKETPIFGVNLGRLGFLTETKVEEATEALAEILDGNYTVDCRMKLECTVESSGNLIEATEILNDIVINKGALARIIEMAVYIDDNYVNSYRADGLIIATPTGSTAYSLAAGGPIVHPSLGCIIITPICPHSLTNRPIVVSDRSVIRIEVNTDDEKVYVTCDGQIGKRLLPGEDIIVRRSNTSARIIRSSHRDFFKLLREKLSWGGQ